MKPCKRWNALLSRHVDGELPPELDTPLREHLGECLPCRERMRQEENASRELRGVLPADEESIFDLESRLLSSTELLLDGQSRAKASRRVHIPAGAVAAAASFFVGVTIWVSFFSGGAPSNETRPDIASLDKRTPLTPQTQFAPPSSVVSLSRQSRQLDLLDLDRTGDLQESYASPTSRLQAGRPQIGQLQKGGAPSRARAEMGLEVIRTRSFILEPPTRSSSSQGESASGTAAWSPRWEIEIERTDTRLVRFTPQQVWY